MTAAVELWDRVLEAFENERILWFALRDGEAPRRGGDDVEVDLLVAPADMARAGEVLERLGFVELRRWGYRPHRFFVAYDAGGDRWLKLDCVTEIAFGRAVHALRTDLATGCLERRRRIGRVWYPSPFDELLMLALHVIVDVRRFSEERRRQLLELAGQLTRADLDDERNKAAAERCFGPATTPADLPRLLADGRWEELLSQRPAIVRRLAAGRQFAIAWSRVRDGALRKLSRLVSMFRPEAVSVALLAPDGAGKSTIAAALASSFFFPVRAVYMGLYQRGRSRGFRATRGLGLAGRLSRQWLRWLVARFHLGRGRFVVFDRYGYDLLLPNAQHHRLRSRLRRWLLGRSCPAPDLVLVLDAPGALLFERKGEQTAAALERQRQEYRALCEHLPQARLIDAAAPLDDVRRAVTVQLWERFAQRNRGRRAKP
ncbi:MAG: hypothetical protein KY476_14235 [Planctomycetes bacterium]|nr:hypothetical protein [Planctomycetota bacterium]